MEPRDHQTSDHEKIADQWLDAALNQYGEAEPRTGLEGRVLMNLRIDRERLTERRNWWPAFVAVAAVVVAGVFFLGKDHPGAKERIAAVQAPVIDHPERSVKPDRKPSMAVISEASIMRKPAEHRWPRHIVETTVPRLEQFPSPQPLSEQERILANYVAQYRQEAVMLARAHTELLERDLTEFEKIPTPSESGQSPDRSRIQ